MYGRMGSDPCEDLRVRPELMPFSQSTLSKFREILDPTAQTLLVHAIQEEGRDRAVRDERVEHCWRVDVRAVIEGEGDCAWDGAVVDDGADWDGREADAFASGEGVVVRERA